MDIQSDEILIRRDAIESRAKMSEHRIEMCILLPMFGRHQ